MHRQTALLLCFSATAILAANIGDGWPRASQRPHHISLEAQSDLNLNPSQLKQFAGHALNLIKAKCPDVNGDMIFQIQKYIGKFMAHIMENGPKKNDGPTQKEEFDGLIASLQTCAKPDFVPKLRADPKEAYAIILDTPPEGFIQMDQNPSDKVGIDFPEYDPKQGEAKTDNKNSGDDEPVVVADTAPKSGRKSRFLAWITAVLHDIGNFFTTAFSSVRRHRRSAPDSEEPVASPSKDVQPIADNEKAREMLLDIVDVVCHIYCDICRESGQIMNFKMAAKELVLALINDDTVLSMANRYLNEGFIQSLQSCTAPQPFGVFPKQ